MNLNNYYMELGWHILEKDGTAHGNWRPERKGTCSIQRGKLAFCRNGLHYSKELGDASDYRNRYGSVVCRVIGFNMLDSSVSSTTFGSPKCVANGRLILWRLKLPSSQKIDARGWGWGWGKAKIISEAKLKGVWVPDPKTDDEWDALQAKFERAWKKNK